VVLALILKKIEAYNTIYGGAICSLSLFDFKVDLSITLKFFKLEICSNVYVYRDIQDENIYSMLGDGQKTAEPGRVYAVVFICSRKGH
jgi:hypothetical protein